jgi:hypothetical protein
MQEVKPRGWKTWGLPLVCLVCARKGPERLRWDIEAERRIAGHNPTHIVYDDPAQFPSEPTQLLEPTPKVQAWVITAADRRFLRSIRITPD